MSEMEELQKQIDMQLYNAELANKIMLDIEKRIEGGDLDVIWVGTTPDE